MTGDPMRPTESGSVSQLRLRITRTSPLSLVDVSCGSWPWLLARRPDGIFINPFERGEIGPDLFRKACEFGLEGLVSKHRDRPYRGGRQKHWIKVKNRKHPAMNRVMESFGWRVSNRAPESRKMMCALLLKLWRSANSQRIGKPQCNNGN